MRKASSKALLLDVNALLALGWPNHQFHRETVRRLERPGERWATCALTELGFIRLSSNPAVTGVSKSPAEACGLLRSLVRDAQHVYLGTLPPPSHPSVGDCFSQILGSKQVTDAYLVSLAARYGAILVTFDSRLAALSESAGRVEVLTG